MILLDGDNFAFMLLFYVELSIFRSSPRRWPSRLELRCVRPYVRTSTKSFSDFHL